MKRQLVVARYEEDISWLTNVPSHWDVCLYNKGSEVDYPSTRIRNIGRESHTYFNHIYQNYDDLADLTIFCQAKPFDHFPQMLEVLQCQTIHEIEEVVVNFFKTSKFFPINRANQGFVSICRAFYYDLLKEKHPFDVITKRYIYRVWSKTYGHPCCFTAFYAIWGAQFAITKKLLQKYSKLWYHDRIFEHLDTRRYFAAPWAIEKILPSLYLLNDDPHEKRGCKIY